MMISCLAMFILAMTIVYFMAIQEANVFNKCTGANVTAYEAMFAEFRIEKCN